MGGGRPGSFLGPSPAWATEDDDLLFNQARDRARELLQARLRARLAVLETGSVDELFLEIRYQVAEASVSGHLSVAGDLHDLAMDLLSECEHSRRL